MRMVDARTHVDVLDHDECVELLRSQAIGRLGFINGGCPDVLPVNYCLDGDAVVFASASGPKVWCAEGRRVAFEVDATNPVTRSGWSVVIHGHAHEVTAADRPGLLERVRSLPIEPWAGGDRPHLVRIEAQRITGRRVGPHDAAVGVTS